MRNNQSLNGLDYGGGVVGKHHFRVRERHVAEHTAPLIKGKAVGAAKLDLVLRGIALLPDHAGARQVGQVLPSVTYEQLHDLCRPASRFTMAIPEDEDYDPVVVEKKRSWVREQLARLEDMRLVRRVERPGRRPLLIVLSDLGDGASFDDPDGRSGNSYLTVSGAIVARWFTVWGGPDLAAYLAAMVADRYSRRLDSSQAIGGATWYQPLHWFSDARGRRPAGHVAIPFSQSTLERGFRALRDADLVRVVRTTRNPRGGRFQHPRSIYENRFAELDTVASIVGESSVVQPAR